MAQRIIKIMGPTYKNKRNHQNGQVAILFALIFTFMFVLFCFVVDFTQLVHAKINLQLAADSAAYSGAAWQARVLNTIGLLNYRMRQDLKEFTMRVKVTHMRHNRGFPHGSSYINGGHQFIGGVVEPFICQQAAGYVAASGLTYAQNTNMCRNASPSTGGLPPIVVPPVIAGFDPFAVAIATQIRRIQQAANQECRAAASDNRRLSEHLVRMYQARFQYHMDQLRELQSFLNQVARESPGSSQHPLVRSAYESALRNLTDSNREGQGFRFEILQPAGGNYLEYVEHSIRASLLFINFQVKGDGCMGYPGFLDFETPVGVSKRRPVVTYFAVKLRAKPRLFFMPRKWIDEAFPELVAVSAAKPFGSRIGPEPGIDPLVPSANRPGINKRELDFSFYPGDQYGIMSTKMMAYFDRLHPFNSLNRPDGNQNSGWPDAGKADQDLRLALTAIRAPTVFDSLFYTVFPDPKPSSDYLEPQYAVALFPDYVEAADESNNFIELPTPRTAAYFPSGVGSKNRGPRWIQLNADTSVSSPHYNQYAGESPSSHSIRSAVGLPYLDNDQKALEFGFAPPTLIHSAWTPENRKGRIGYSVKFISFDALSGSLEVTEQGNSTAITNPPTGDPNTRRVWH
ncbi:MAG: pilus assembly protein [Deltaproteobacteria bacterium]|nr:pilus assembly protein [Deltaproteobacteria bacterium]